LERSNGETGRLYKKPKNAEASTSIVLRFRLASPQDQAEAGDLANFAGGGAELYLFEIKNA
jgi:hypothetical protein